jgi:hypothetical protein
MASPKNARGARTAIQGGAGYLVAELIDTFVDLDKTQLALVAVLLTALFSWVQTAVEDYTGKALLREIPEPNQPVADNERGESWVGFAVGVAAILLAIYIVLALVR